jgi:hypothetical protein
MKTKFASGNPEDELYRSLSQHISRETCRAEADALFGGTAAENRKRDRAALERLFVQTPAAQIQSPNLLAEGKEKQSFEIKPEDRSSIPKKEYAQPGKKAPEGGGKGKYPIPDAQHYRSALGFAKMHGDTKAEAAIRAKGKAMGYGDEKEKKSALASLASTEPAEQEIELVEPNLTANVDAFFEKLSAPDEAQQRYPELLKVAQKPAVNLKPRPKDQDPVRSDLSGGSA